MATKDHTLDEPILNSAMEEFLSNGFEKASLRKIAAAAGVTVGAIYTRWPTKDLLFCALVQPLLDRIAGAFEKLRTEYRQVSGPADMVRAVKEEGETILHLLFDDRDRAQLLLCRSGGSSLEQFFDGIVEEKIRETAAFFQEKSGTGPDERVLRLLIGGQFHMYREVVAQGWSLEEARKVMAAAMVYHEGGWAALLGLKEEKGSVGE